MTQLIYQVTFILLLITPTWTGYHHRQQEDPVDHKRCEDESPVDGKIAASINSNKTCFIVCSYVNGATFTIAKKDCDYCESLGDKPQPGHCHGDERRCHLGDPEPELNCDSD